MNRQSRFVAGIQDAWGWCTGMTQRDGMGRQVGGVFRMGNTCTPVVDSCQWGVGDGQGGLACCNSWGCKESYTTEQLN